MDTVAEMRQAIETECAALRQCMERLDAEAAGVVEAIHACSGRVVVMGLGKCGHVGRKIAATFASTGTPATYVHPAEALHGDLGFIAPGDVALVLSNSGETPEIRDLLPHLKRMGLPVFALTSGLDSTLARSAARVIDTGVPREADPLGMVPTSSTTVMLAVGDALAVVLMKLRRFTPSDYGLVHPGGSLGARLLCLVEELMHRDRELPLTSHAVTVREAIVELSSKRLGATFIVDDAGRLAGIFTDGDLRRALEHHSHPLDLCVEEVMTLNPKQASPDMLAVDALRKMEDNLITILPVVREGVPVGAIHMHDLIRLGIQS